SVVTAIRPPAGQADERQLAELVRAARDGDRNALGELVSRLTDDVYRLALCMTAPVADAQAAAQEVMVKVGTRLDSFGGEASVRTWTYRIAVRHLLDRTRSRVELLGLDFDRFATDLLDGLEAAGTIRDPDSVDPLLCEEVKLGCTLAMLTCLDRD